MGKIDFTKDALVFFENEAYRVIKTVSLSKVMIQNEKSKQIITTEIDKLASKLIEQSTQDHIDNYSEKE